MGIGDGGWGIGDWGLGPIPNPQSPIPIKIDYLIKKKIYKLLIININILVLSKIFNFKFNF